MSALDLIEAEEYRRSHCNRQELTHQCMGKVTIAPGVLSLDCALCGSAHEILEQELDLCNTARILTNILGVAWSSLPPLKQKQVLIELLALLRKRPDPVARMSELMEEHGL